MTPLGHLAVSYSLAKGTVARSTPHAAALPALIGGGLAPDVDFLLLGLPNFNALHRSLTHNLFFVLAVAGLCALLVFLRRGVLLRQGTSSGRKGGSVTTNQAVSLAVFLAAVTGGFAHLFLDAILDSNASNGVGVAALWPLSEAFFSPFNLAQQRCSGWENPLDATLCNLPLILYEVPFYLLAALLWWRVRKGVAR